MSTLKMLVVLGLAVTSTVIIAQGKSNFSGTWKCDAKRSTDCNADTVIVKHTGDTVAVQGPGEKAVVQTYKLDGTETTLDPAQEVGFTGRKLPQSKATGRWEGATIVMETRGLEENPRISKSVWRLSADGKELTIESTRSGRTGDGKGKTVWTKAGSY